MKTKTYYENMSYTQKNTKYLFKVQSWACQNQETPELKLFMDH